jgi:hypothetical protein
MEYRPAPSARQAGETANVFPEFGIMLKDLPIRVVHFSTNFAVCLATRAAAICAIA